MELGKICFHKTSSLFSCSSCTFLCECSFSSSFLCKLFESSNSNVISSEVRGLKLHAESRHFDKIVLVRPSP